MATAARRGAVPTREPRLTVASRLALREILAHRVRSLLIVLLIAVPVATVVGAMTVQASNDPTTADRIRARLGETATARIPSDRLQCPVQDPMWERSCAPYAVPPAAPRTADQPPLAGLLPTGAETWTVRTVPTRVTVVDEHRTRAGLHARVWEHALLQGPTASLSRLERGSLPGPGEVVVDRSGARYLGVTVGSTIRLEGQDLRVSGVVRADLDAGGGIILAEGTPLPAMDTGQSRYDADSTVTWVTGANLSWDAVQKLNQNGYGAFSRQVALDPPPMPGARQPQNARSLLLYGLVGGLAALTVVSICGAAFAISVKQQRRSLGLLAATGAEQAMLGRVVRQQGLMLGLAGVVAGALAGILGGYVVAGWLDAAYVYTRWGLHVPWLGLVISMAVGLLAAVVAATLPARDLRRLDALAAVRTAIAPSTAPRFPRIGLSVATAGLLLCAVLVAFARLTRYNALRGSESAAMGRLLVGLALVAVLLLVGGALASITWFLQLLGRLVPSLSLRLALRDGVRNRARTTPSVASVLTIAMLAASALVLYAGSLQATLDGDNAQVLRHQVAVGRGTGSGADTTRLDESRIAEIARGVVPVSGTADLVVLRAVVLTPPDKVCHQDYGTDEYDADPNCAPLAAPVTSVAAEVDPAALPVLLGRTPTADELEAFSRGEGLVLTDHLLDGQVCRVTGSQGIKAAAEPASTAVPCRLAVPEERVSQAALLLPRGSGAKQGWAENNQVIVVEVGRDLRWEEGEDLRQAYAAAFPESAFVMLPRLVSPLERQTGWIIAGSAMLVVLLVAAITTALTVGDGRSDEATFAAIGAGPTFRKRMAAGQLAVVAGAGTLIGAAIAVVILATFAGVFGRSAPPLAVPWGQLATLCVVTPVVGALVAWVVTPGRLVMVRRLE